MGGGSGDVSRFKKLGACWRFDWAAAAAAVVLTTAMTAGTGHTELPYDGAPLVTICSLVVCDGEHTGTIKAEATLNLE